MTSRSIPWIPGLRWQRIHEPDAGFPLAVLVMARDEESDIATVLARLRSQLLPGDTLHVVADHCQDNTAVAAALAGAQVHHRRVGRPGKGPALSWWMERFAGPHRTERGIVILDADSCPAPGLLGALRRRLTAGQRAVQARVVPEVSGGDVIPLLAAFSEELEQNVFDRVRRTLGWPVRLRGTGMGFRTRALNNVVGDLVTSVEDAELSLLLLDSGCAVRSVPETFVLDPKPTSAASAERQRARWLQGQIQLLRAHPSPILRAVLRGPAGWSLLSSTLIKPHSFLLPFKVLAALFGVGLWSIGLAAPGVALALTMPVLGAGGGILFGLLTCSPDRRHRYLRALARSYQYPLMWVRSMQLAIASRDPWLRARPHPAEAEITEARTAGP